ncbi:MAG: LacI family DNA-binding transcriptional regulator [Shewanella sp.]|nr:LacI family DNA-binding transcriptional regulator [Shewanella sp.]
MSAAQKSRPSLQDIADRIGITKMTVSRYMRDPSSVAASTRDKIAKEMEATGYIQKRAPAM